MTGSGFGARRRVGRSPLTALTSRTGPGHLYQVTPCKIFTQRACCPERLKSRSASVGFSLQLRGPMSSEADLRGNGVLAHSHPHTAHCLRIDWRRRSAQRIRCSPRYSLPIPRFDRYRRCWQSALLQRSHRRLRRQFALAGLGLSSYRRHTLRAMRCSVGK